MSDPLLADVENRLRKALGPEHLELDDETERHRGHRGFTPGKRHLRARIVSPAFEGRSRIERHRQVYEALGELMSTSIHALSVEAWTPAERRNLNESRS